MALPIFDDERNLEVFQLCCDIIGRTTKQITATNNKLQNLMGLEEHQRLLDEAQKLIQDIKPCFNRIEKLRNSMDDKIPDKLLKQYGVRANMYNDAVRIFNILQRK